MSRSLALLTRIIIRFAMLEERIRPARIFGRRLAQRVDQASIFQAHDLSIMTLKMLTEFLVVIEPP